MLKLLSNLDAHQRALTALAVAFIVFLASFSVEHLPFRIILTWNAFALTGILMAWSRIIFADAKTAVISAKLQDTSRSINPNCLPLTAYFEPSRRLRMVMTKLSAARF